MRSLISSLELLSSTGDFVCLRNRLFFSTSAFSQLVAYALTCRAMSNNHLHSTKRSLRLGSRRQATSTRNHTGFWYRNPLRTAKQPLWLADCSANARRFWKGELDPNSTPGCKLCSVSSSLDVQYQQSHSHRLMYETMTYFVCKMLWHLRR